MSEDALPRPVRVGDVASTVLNAFPAQWAEPWDRVGLIAGDADAVVSGVLVTLDPTARVLERAIRLGANVIASHHPAFLEPPAATDSGHVVNVALASGVSLIAAHTNLDRAPDGAPSLARALGLPDGAPIERGLQPMKLVTVFAPQGSADAVLERVAAVGAGRIGMYSACSFAAEGVGRYRPSSGSHPFLGNVDEPGVAPETRIEVVCAPGDELAVTGAIREVHPYEEPLIVVSEISISRGVARLGRVCDLASETTLDALASRVSKTLGCVPRVCGAARTRISRVATATGSAGSLLADVRAAGAQALVAGEVRYHDALAAMDAGVCIIEAGHDVTEWPLVPVLAEAVKATPGLDVPVTVDDASRNWWTP